jgi:hypothetical protein
LKLKKVPRFEESGDLLYIVLYHLLRRNVLKNQHGKSKIEKIFPFNPRQVRPIVLVEAHVGNISQVMSRFSDHLFTNIRGIHLSEYTCQRPCDPAHATTDLKYAHFCR